MTGHKSSYIKGFPIYATGFTSDTVSAEGQTAANEGVVGNLVRNPRSTY